MSTIARGLSARMVKLGLQPSQKNQFAGLGLVRYSTAVPRFGYFETGEEHGGYRFGNRGFFSIITLGGLGLGMAKEYQAKCTEKEDKVSGQCMQNHDEANLQRTKPMEVAEPAVKTFPEAKGHPFFTSLLARFRSLELLSFGEYQVACATKRNDWEKEIIEKANQDLEKDLEDLRERSFQAELGALCALSEVSQVVKDFNEKEYGPSFPYWLKLKPSEYQEKWSELRDFALKCAKVTPNGETAWKVLCKYREVIKAAKDHCYTSSNPRLVKAENTSILYDGWYSGKDMMKCIERDTRMVQELREIIEKIRQDLKAELDSVPECNSVPKDEQFTKILTLTSFILPLQQKLADLEVNVSFKISFLTSLYEEREYLQEE